jgi:KTSC domain
MRTMPPIIQVESSNVYGLSYDLHAQEMFVQFKNKGSAGSVYRYIAVPPEVYQSFMNSPSKGSYFASQIRNRYHSEKIQ